MPAGPVIHIAPSRVPVRLKKLVTFLRAPDNARGFPSDFTLEPRNDKTPLPRRTFGNREIEQFAESLGQRLASDTLKHGSDPNGVSSRRTGPLRA